MPRKNLLRFNGFENCASIVKADRRSFETRGLHAGDFENNPFWCEVSETDLNVGVFLEGRIDWCDEVLVFRNLRNILKILFKTFACHRHAGSVKQSHVEETSEY